jgi:hypothetical protein
LVENVDDCPVNTAGRQLMPEEIRLRTTWIHAVYLMLEHIAHQNQDKRMVQHDIDKDVRNTYTTILPLIVALKESNGKFLAQDMVEANTDILGLDENVQVEDPLQFAICSQTVRLRWFTLTVLKEEKLANDTSDDDMIRKQLAEDKKGAGGGTGLGKNNPRPPIPRGSGFN